MIITRTGEAMHRIKYTNVDVWVTRVLCGCFVANTLQFINLVSAKLKSFWYINFNNFQTRFLSQQNTVPEPDIQPSYSPVGQQGWTSESNHEQGDDTSNNDNEQLIENIDEGTPQQQEPYLRTSKAVSFVKAFYYQNFHNLVSVLVVSSLLDSLTAPKLAKKPLKIIVNA